MNIKRIQSNVFNLTLHSFELAALVAAARWVSEGSQGELPAMARAQLQNVIENYDAERQRLEVS
jgi:predicted DNA-binding transcriptional regulator YafY